MKLKEYQNFKKLIKYYTEGENLSEMLNNYKRVRASMGTTYGAGLLMVQYGEFAIFYKDVIKDLAKIYGDEFNLERYYTKNKELKYRDGECYAWTVYKHKIARALETMVRKGEL